MRGATMRATRDYSPHKVAESVQGGEGQFLELWRLLLEALSWSIVLAVSVWISYKIHQLPDMHVKKHRATHLLHINNRAPSYGASTTLRFVTAPP